MAMTGQVTSSLDTSNMGVLHDMQLDYYGKRAAAASADCSAYVFEIIDGQQQLSAQLKEHEGPVWKVAWAHPKFGSVLATCSYDMKVIVWKEVQPSRWQIAYMDSSHTASVNSIQFCPWEHGLRLACASSDGTVSVLAYGADNQWRRSAFAAHPSGAQAVCWAPAAQRADGAAPSMRLVTGGCDNSLQVWRCEGETWSQEQPAIGLAGAAHTDWVRDVAWKPDTAQSVIASGSWDKTVCIWLQEREGQPWRQVCKLAVAGRVEGLSWSVTGSILAVSCGEADASLYKETYDGRYEEIGKINEPGFMEVPNSMTAAPQAANVAAHPTSPTGAPAAQPQSELQQQQAAVLEAFGPM